MRTKILILIDKDQELIPALFKINNSMLTLILSAIIVYVPLIIFTVFLINKAEKDREQDNDYETSRTNEETRNGDTFV